jgi:hypothetical protein
MCENRQKDVSQVKYGRKGKVCGFGDGAVEGPRMKNVYSFRAFISSCLQWALVLLLSVNDVGRIETNTNP